MNKIILITIIHGITGWEGMFPSAFIKKTKEISKDIFEEVI